MAHLHVIRGKFTTQIHTNKRITVEDHLLPCQSDGLAMSVS